MKIENMEIYKSALRRTVTMLTDALDEFEREAIREINDAIDKKRQTRLDDDL